MSRISQAKGIVSWGLRQRKWFTIWWTLGIVSLVLMTILLYPSMRDQSAELEKSFSDLPDAAMALLSDTGDFFSPIGYVSSQLFYMPLPLLLSILAISLGTSLIGKEEREGTIELLLSRPISRGLLLLSKVKTGGIIIAIVAAAAFVATAITARLVDLPIPIPNILFAVIGSVLLSLCFGAIGFTITALGGMARGAAVGVASLLATASYLITSLSQTISWLKWPSMVLPFHYYKPAAILEGTHNYANWLYMVGLLIVLGVISWIAFRRRDIGV